MLLPIVSALGDTETANPLQDLSAVQVDGDLAEAGDGFSALLAAMGEKETPLQASLASIGAPVEKGLAELSAIQLPGLHDAVPQQVEQALTDLTGELQDLLLTLAETPTGEDIPSSILQQLESLDTRIGQWLEQSPSPALAGMQSLVQALANGLAELPAGTAQLPVELGSVLVRLLGPDIPAKLQARAQAQGLDAGGKHLPQTAMGPGSLSGAAVPGEPAALGEIAGSVLSSSSDPAASQYVGIARDPWTSRQKTADGNVSFQLKSLAAGDMENPSAQADIDVDALVHMPESLRLPAHAAVMQQAMDPVPNAPPVAVAGHISGVPAGGGSMQVGAAVLPQLPAIGPSPGESAWSQALGERVLWMAGRDVQQAEVRLNPPQLGPVEIRISMHNDQASVSLLAQHPFTRDALEASLPRLREMLGEANIDLADVDVGQSDARESGAGQGKREGGTGDGGGNWLAGAEASDGEHSETLLRTRSGLVDDFA